MEGSRTGCPAFLSKSIVIEGRVCPSRIKLPRRRRVPKKRDTRRASLFFGAGGGTRTHTMSPPTDFESVTSTNSITPAITEAIIRDAKVFCKQNFGKSKIYVNFPKEDYDF